MAKMPSPVDLRIWLLSRVLGWPGRRIASEVGVSQPTVVRTLERLQNDPPTGDEMKEFVSTGTPPKGMPVLKARAPSTTGGTTPLMLAFTGAVILITLAVTVVLIALAVAILSH